MDKIRLGFAMCGSFCTFQKAFEELEGLIQQYTVVPIMSETAYYTDTRFGQSKDFVNRMEKLCKCDIIKSIVEAEPLGPKNQIDILLIEPCTGNTVGKLAHGITDTSVTMAAKSILRVNKPVVLALSSNDSLAATGQNMGRLLNTKNIYFVPMRQDDVLQKPWSLSADFKCTEDTIKSALLGKQLQPIFI